MIVIKDRLDDAKALSPMLVTVDVRHTFRIVLSSGSNTQYTIHNNVKILEFIIMSTSIRGGCHRSPVSRIQMKNVNINCIKRCLDKHVYQNRYEYIALH